MMCERSSRMRFFFSSRRRHTMYWRDWSSDVCSSDLWVYTHDSVGLGEDGPTHQPVEHYMALRAIPNLTVIRPADANETSMAWRSTLEAEGPVAMLLTRQNIPVLDRTVLAGAEGTLRGAYVLADAGDTGDGVEPDTILIATGSEVAVALEAHDLLGEKGV